MAKSKKELKEKARKAASKGTLSGKLVNKLKAAGVKNKVVNNIKTANSKGYAANRAQTVLNNSRAQRAATASRPNPAKPASHWSNYDYGSSFSRKDVKDLQKSGKYKNNQIMKIAQTAYAGGDVKKVNKTNELMIGLNSQYTNPRQNTNYVQGEKRTSSVYPQGKMPKRVFSWNGFGNGMNINTMSGADEGFKYQPTSAWSLPTKFMNGLKPNDLGDDNLDNNNNNNNSTDNNTTTTTTTTAITPEEEDSTDLGTGMMSGGGMGAAGASKLGRSKSRLRKLGIYGRGTSLLGRGLQYGNALNA